MKKNLHMKERICRLTCTHCAAWDRGPVQLWDGRKVMLKQCSACGTLFVDGFDPYDELPDMTAPLKETAGD